MKVAPARERGLKYLYDDNNIMDLRRSREGAWIEIIAISDKLFVHHHVAPARERGLKLILYLFAIYPENRRSREGAWIEI